MENRFSIEKFSGRKMSKEHAEYIKFLIKKASEVDINNEVFGASSHKYKLNPVI